VLEIGTDRLVEQNVRIDEKEFVDSLGMNEVTKGEILLVAEENPRVLVVGEMFVGKELGEFPSFFEVVLVSMAFNAEVKAIAAVAEQDQPTLRI
jgi:hypothetical protein